MMTQPHRRILLLVPCAIVFAARLILPAAAAAKPPDITKDKFPKITEFLELTDEQVDLVRPKVARIQEIFRMAKRQRDQLGGGRSGGFGGIGGFGGLPGGRGGGRPAPRPSDGGDRERPDPEAMMEERRGWELELKSLVSRIEAELTEAQLELFSEIETPELPEPPGRRRRP